MMVNFIKIIMIIVFYTAEDYIPKDMNEGYFISYNDNNERIDVKNV